MWTKERWQKEYKKSVEEEKNFINRLTGQKFTFYSIDRYIHFLEKWILELKTEKEFLEDELKTLRVEIRDTRYE